MRILTFFVLMLALPAAAAAQNPAVGVRAEGMGGAFVAVADDASAVYWNPAGVAMGALFDFQVSGGPASTLFVGAALPVLGASYYRLRRDVPFPTVSPSPDRENEGSEKVPGRPLTTTNLGVTVVQTVVTGVVIGTTARIVRGGIDTFATSTKVDLDAGLLVSVGAIRAGLTGRNLRQPEFEAGTGAVSLRRHVRAGAAYAPRSLPSGVHGPFTLAVDVDVTKTALPSGEARMAAAGGEYWIAQGRMGLRAGVRWSASGAPYRAMSGGVTAALPRSLFVDVQMTDPRESEAREWSLGARVTF